MMTQQQADTSRFLFAAGQIEFLVVRMDLREGISRLFEAELQLATEEEVDTEAVLGQTGLLTLQGEESDRFVHGLVREFEVEAMQGRFNLYRIKLVPTVWLLSQRRDCRIFQNQNTPDIVRQVLEGIGLTADLFAFRLQSTYQPRTYCVQYRESDLNFIKRLLEEEGIFFFFEHNEEKHILVFGDSTVNYQPVAAPSEVPFNTGAGLVPEEEAVYRFTRRQRILSGKYTHTDYNFERPALNLMSENSCEQYDDLEVYDCPGEFANENDGRQLARVRLEQCRQAQDTARGRSTCVRMQPGFTFDLSGHDNEGCNAAYLITSLHHVGRQTQVLGERSDTSQESGYSNMFRAVPATVPARPSPCAHKPVVQGVETAMVTGPEGEEIYPDQYGRVKVQFHWDRLGQRDENSSCWIRVSQTWAGAGWGAMFIPRIGQEVVVSFIGGDPDRPIITGSVYHGTNMPPYDLPGEKTKSTLRTYSSTQGQGCNEIRFEDKKDEEELFIQAQKDMNLHVKQDQKTYTGRDCHLVADRDRLDNISRDLHVKVAGHEKREIDQDHNNKISGKSAVDVGGSFSLKVGGDVIEAFQSNHVERVSNGYKLSAANAVVEAAANLTLKCGGSSIVLTPGGIFIQGMPVNVNCGAGPAGSVAGGGLVAPAAPLAASVVEAVTADMSEEDAAAHDAPAHQSSEEGDWIEIELVDEDDNPVAGERYRITLPDDTTVAQGTTGADGVARVSGFDPGSCRVTFPDLDRDAWEKI